MFLIRPSLLPPYLGKFFRGFQISIFYSPFLNINCKSTSCYLSPENSQKRKRPCFHDPDTFVSIIIFLISAIIAIGQATIFITLNKSVQTYMSLSFHKARTTSSLQYLSMSITICTTMPITKYVIIISLSFIKVSVIFAIA